jgi:hypothetical protein
MKEQLNLHNRKLYRLKFENIKALKILSYGMNQYHLKMFISQCFICTQIKAPNYISSLKIAWNKNPTNSKKAK